MTIQEALQELKRGAEWILRGDTYDDLEWLDKVQTKPSEADVTAKMAQETAEALAKAAAEAKLAALGLTTDDLKALGL